MAALTGEDVLSGIALKLSSQISSAEIAKIYKNKPLQGMEKPCAFLHQIDYAQTNEMRNRANRDYLVDIRVHPADDEQKIQSWGAKLGEKILTSVSSININDKPVKLKRGEWKIESDVLHVIVSYSFKVIQEITDTTPFMETLNHTERVI